METQAIESRKWRTITMTLHPPVKIVERDWPIIAEVRYDQNDRLIILKVRQHADRRCLVYGTRAYRREGHPDDMISAGYLVHTYEGVPDSELYVKVAARIYDTARELDRMVSDVVAMLGCSQLPAQELG